MEFTASVEDVNEVTRQIKVSIPVETVDSEIDTALTQLAKNTKVKGFRPGKAPRALLEKMHGSRVRMEVANRLISSSLQDTITEHKIEMIGSPEIDVASIEPGKEIEYTASVAIFPRPDVVGYDSITVEVEKSSVGDEDVDSAINNILESKAELKDIEGRTKAKEGDVVDASVKVQIEGEDGASTEPLVVRLGAGRVPEELEKGIEGMEVGSSKEIESALPDDHPSEELQGKKVTYEVTLNKLQQQVNPELTDAFVKALEFEAETVLELKLKVREQLESGAEEEGKNKTNTEILDILLEKNEFLVPQILIDDEIRNMLGRSGMVDPQKIDISQINAEPFREQFGEMAEKRVKTAVIVDRIGEQEELRATDNDVDDELKEIAERTGMQLEQVRGYFLERERVVGFMMEITRNKVLEFLREKASIKFVEKKDDADKKDDKKKSSARSASKKKAASKEKSTAKKSSTKKKSSAKKSSAKKSAAKSK